MVVVVSSANKIKISTKKKLLFNQILIFIATCQQRQVTYQLSCTISKQSLLKFCAKQKRRSYKIEDKKKA